MTQDTNLANNAAYLRAKELVAQLNQWSHEYYVRDTPVVSRT